MKIKCNLCTEPAVIMKDAKNGGKNFYCYHHYIKKQEREVK